MKKTDMIKAPVAVVPRAEHVMGPVAEIKEQDEHQCGENEHWDEEKQQCVANKPAEAAEQEETPSPPCPDGWHEVDGACVKNEASEQEEQASIAPPKTMDETPSEEKPEEEEPINPVEEAPVDAPIVTVPVPPEEEVVLEGYKIPETLRLGEPFAGYDSFDDCVSKNPDKDDPDAYCADIMRKVEGGGAAEMKLTENLYDSQRELANAVKKVDKNSYIRSMHMAENLNKLGKLFEKIDKNEKAIIQYLNNREKTVNKILQETVANTNKAFKSLPKDNLGWKNIKPYNDKELREKIAQIKPYDDKPLREKIDAIKPYDDKPLCEKLEQLEKKIDEKDALIEKVAGERNKLVEDLQKETEKLKADVEEAKADKKQLQETLGTRLDNLEDKQRGDFKGKHVKETKKDDSSIPTDKNPLEEK